MSRKSNGKYQNRKSKKSHTFVTPHGRFAKKELTFDAPARGCGLQIVTEDRTLTIEPSNIVESLERQNDYDAIIFQNHRDDSVIVKFRSHVRRAFDAYTGGRHVTPSQIKDRDGVWFLGKVSNHLADCVFASAMWFDYLTTNGFKVVINDEQYR